MHRHRPLTKTKAESIGREIARRIAMEDVPEFKLTLGIDWIRRYMKSQLLLANFSPRSRALPAALDAAEAEWLKHFPTNASKKDNK